MNIRSESKEKIVEGKKLPMLKKTYMQNCDLRDNGNTLEKNVHKHNSNFFEKLFLTFHKLWFKRHFIL